MANGQAVHDELQAALKCCPSHPAFAEVHADLELAERSARSNRGWANALEHAKEARDCLKDPAVVAAGKDLTELERRLKLAIDMLTRRGRRAAKEEAENSEEPETEAKPRGRRKPARPRRIMARARSTPAPAPSQGGAAIDVVLERTADGAMTIRARLQPGDLRALIQGVL